MQNDPALYPPADWRYSVATLAAERSADPAHVGPDLAALARLRDLLPVPTTAYAVSPPALWTSPAADPIQRRLRSLLGPYAAATTIRGWLLPAGRPIGPVFYNIGSAAIGEAASELAGVGLRQSAGDGSALLVVSAQMFVPAEVSVLVSVEPADGTVRLDSCLALNEDLGAGMWYDVLVLSGPSLAVRSHRVVHKPTATAAARGGTQVINVTPTLRGKPSLPLARAVPMAETCLRMTERLGTPARFEIGLAGAETYLLMCHAQ